jgi:hypothetical protein
LEWEGEGDGAKKAESGGGVNSGRCDRGLSGGSLRVIWRATDLDELSGELGGRSFPNIAIQHVIWICAASGEDVDCDVIAAPGEIRKLFARKCDPSKMGDFVEPNLDFFLSEEYRSEWAARIEGLVPTVAVEIGGYSHCFASRLQLGSSSIGQRDSHVEIRSIDCLGMIDAGGSTHDGEAD